MIAGNAERKFLQRNLSSSNIAYRTSPFQTFTSPMSGVKFRPFTNQFVCPEVTTVPPTSSSAQRRGNSSFCFI